MAAAAATLLTVVRERSRKVRYRTLRLSGVLKSGAGGGRFIMINQGLGFCEMKKMRRVGLMGRQVYS